MVLVGVAEVQLTLDAVGEQVRTVGRGGGEVGAVEAGRGGHSVRIGAGCAQCQAGTHAVAGDANRSTPGHRAFGQPAQVGVGVRHRRLRRQGLDERPDPLEDLGALGRAHEVRQIDHRRPPVAVEDVGHQDRVPGRSQTVGHLLQMRAQPEGVHVEQNGGKRARPIRVHQVGIGCAVPRGDVHGGSMHSTHTHLFLSFEREFVDISDREMT